MNKRKCMVLVMFVAGCQGEVEDLDDVEMSQSREDTTQEIVDNLAAAGFPESETEVKDDGRVIVGGDAEVTLGASREMIGLPTRGERLESERFRQYRTTNLVSPAVHSICINDSFTGTLSAALDAAIANFNGQNLSFSMSRSGTGCDATINANEVGGNGGSAGFPSGGLPYGTINIGSGIASFGTAVATHVITHELGHCVGFRHSDYYNRSISCGSGGDEGQAGVGAIHIPNTPTTAVFDGSVMNSCFNGGSTGQWTDTDVVALGELYGGVVVEPPADSCEDRCGSYDASRACQCDVVCDFYGDCCDDKYAQCDAPPPPEPSPTSCYTKCGQNAGQCWCDAACSFYGDCCDDKIDYCG